MERTEFGRYIRNKSPKVFPKFANVTEVANRVFQSPQ